MALDGPHVPTAPSRRDLATPLPTKRGSGPPPTSGDLRIRRATRPITSRQDDAARRWRDHGYPMMQGHVSGRCPLVKPTFIVQRHEHGTRHIPAGHGRPRAGDSARWVFGQWVVYLPTAD